MKSSTEMAVMFAPTPSESVQVSIIGFRQCRGKPANADCDRSEQQKENVKARFGGFSPLFPAHPSARLDGFGLQLVSSGDL